MASGVAKQNAFQNAFQHADKLESFSYAEIGNESATFVVLILVFVLLVALLRSEARYRSLLERMLSKTKE